MQLRDRLFAICKATFHKDNIAARKLFLGADIFMRIVWHADTDEGDEMIIGWDLRQRVFHIPRVVLSPYELELTEVEMATASERMEANAIDSEEGFKAEDA